MRYADSHCDYIEKLDPHRYVFKGKCIVCEKMITVEVKAEELHEYRKGQLIQDCLKSNNSAEREFLISGCCDSCFDEMWKYLPVKIK
jgi:hypothetical protein